MKWLNSAALDIDVSHATPPEKTLQKFVYRKLPGRSAPDKKRLDMDYLAVYFWKKQ